MSSSFLSPSTLTKDGQLASLHLSHNLSVPVILSSVASTVEEQGYAEGVVTNTKFGSFPHSTLLNVSWGSQVRASKVDTGSRGRKQNHAVKKRKADAISTDSPADVESPGSGYKEATLANSGYLHILLPTPENWTRSLPHRTQVVYTPDYSYILHRIRARPGSVLIEAGSGSGSFTHAAARAVYDGSPLRPSSASNGTDESHAATSGKGRVYTYEFHPERHEKVEIEMKQHGLDKMVTATHRDVYKDGFLLKNKDSTHISPAANAVFLDLPAPWEALKHLSREGDEGKPSALDPSNTVHICTFSPCIEQVQKTISQMRKSGWIDIEMVEMAQKRVDVRREFTGLKYDGMRSVNVFAADVDEAIARLRVIEDKARLYHATAGDEQPTSITKTDSTAQNAQLDAAKVLYKDGSLVHRSEPELKTHTSYLVFAILPRTWTEEDEEQARNNLESTISATPPAPKSQRQLKRDAKQRKKSAKGQSKASRQEEAVQE